MKVSQIRQQQAFRRYKATNGNLGMAACCLWQELLCQMSDAGKGNDWPDGFVRISNRTLLANLPELSDSTFRRARAELIENGLIEYEPGSKSDFPLYRMIYFSEETNAVSHSRRDCVQIPGQFDQECEQEHEQENTVSSNSCARAETKTKTKTQTQTETSYSDSYSYPEKDIEDDDDDDEITRMHERAREAVENAFVTYVGRRGKPAEIELIATTAVLSDLEPAMAQRAVRKAAMFGAINIAKYATSVINNWRANHVYTEADADEVEYFHNSFAHYDKVDLDAMNEARERRKAAHEAGKAAERGQS